MLDPRSAPLRGWRTVDRGYEGRSRDIGRSDRRWIANLLCLLTGERFEGEVAYVVNQPTLLATWPELDTFVRSIGPLLACAWCALERSRNESSPVATEGLAVQALETLSALRVLDAVPLPLAGNAARSRYEPLAWSYRAPWSRPDVDLGYLLTTILLVWARECPVDSKRRLWETLAEGEASAYLASLLRKHRMSPEVGKRLRSLAGSDWEQLSLGRKRYVLWSSMRGAASELLRTGMSEDRAIAALDREVGTRCKWLLQRELAGGLAPTDYCFFPSPEWRRPLILDVALATFLPIGNAYWAWPVGRWKF